MTIGLKALLLVALVAYLWQLSSLCVPLKVWSGGAHPSNA